MSDASSDPQSFTEQRHALVENRLRSRGIQDERVLDAMNSVPREEFVPLELQNDAYTDAPLPIGEGQTISQPSVVALMVELLELKPNDRVLEVGTGSGYAAAVLSLMAKEVYTIEQSKLLARVSSGRLKELGYANVLVKQGDGAKGWAEHAPFDAIIAAAAATKIPFALFDQLCVGGRLVIPVGQRDETQQLLRIWRVAEDEYEEEWCGDVRFVPMLEGIEEDS
ncbi:MAG: protein-L-isoaspartate(D-aspartate) O-methyltransferase [Gemmataceae bacterium]